MDSKIIKKTQDTLGKAIKKPPLTDKLLSKPPFRFLHDVFTSVIKTTGFMKGLFSDKELNSENIKDRDSKIAFLQKAIDFVSMVTGKSLAVRPQKIVAGSEPEKTNEFLQALAEAIKMKVNNDEYVKKFNKISTEDEEEKIEPEKDREKKKHKSEEKRDKDKEKHRSRDREKDRSRERSHEEGKGDDQDREKDKEKDKDERTKEKRSKRRGDAGKENQHPSEQTREHENQESPARIPRPTSAKGSRRRREEDEVFHQKPTRMSDQAVTEEDLPPQVVAARKLQRPPSARPAPPRPKQDGMESEPAMRLGTGNPTNVIVDDGKQSDDDDDDDNFIVEDTTPQPVELDQHLPKQEVEDDTEHGALVKKMLETKKEFEEQPQGLVKKTEIERPSMSDAARRKQREVVKREIEKICSSIQDVTRSANPLGKIMDYVQEDLDSMQKELEKWRAENKEHALEIKRESGITDRSIEPLKAQLAELEQAISDKLDLIAATKSKIIKNDSKIEKLLTSMSKS